MVLSHLGVGDSRALYIFLQTIRGDDLFRDVAVLALVEIAVLPPNRHLHRFVFALHDEVGLGRPDFQAMLYHDPFKDHALLGVIPHLDRHLFSRHEKPLVAQREITCRRIAISEDDCSGRDAVYLFRHHDIYHVIDGRKLLPLHHNFSSDKIG